MKPFATAVTASFLSATTLCAGTISPDHPDGILCPMAATQDRPAGVSAFYLSAVLSDGRVLYQTLGNQVLSVTFDPSGSPVMESYDICQGNTLAELATDGKTF